MSVCLRERTDSNTPNQSTIRDSNCPPGLALHLPHVRLKLDARIHTLAPTSRVIPVQFTHYYYYQPTIIWWHWNFWTTRLLAGSFTWPLTWRASLCFAHTTYTCCSLRRPRIVLRLETPRYLEPHLWMHYPNKI